jgi:hypothetical protein
MKSIVMPKTAQLNEETKTKLSQEVKETLAREVIASTSSGNDEKTNPITTGFTATDMWNRNRKSRSASDMMRRWNLN